MTPSELAQLGPYFRDGERYLNGTPIDWETVSYETMRAVYRLRVLLDTKIVLIRGPHPDPTGTKPYKKTAIDACAPGADLGHVAMALFRLQAVSYGIYSGNSFHLDSRPFAREPARWLAIKEAEARDLDAAGLRPLITDRADGWIYLNWSHERASDGLSLVLQLARGHSRDGSAQA